LSIIENFLYSSLQWFTTNIINIVLTLIFIVIVYVFNNLSQKQITRFKDEGRIDDSVSLLLSKTLRWGSIIGVIAIIIAQLGIRIDLVAGLLVLASGTVIGYAAMNTLGNAFAGILLMVSKPFSIGDRVFFENKFADVEEIDLIYTRMKTTDNVIISIPNQKLIQTEIEKYGKGRVVRRRHSITASYEDSPETVEGALLEAASKVKGVLIEPMPYVWITEFQNFAVEYTLFVFIRNLKRIQEIDSAVRKSIYETCKNQGIDISTPSLVRSLKT